MHTPTQTVLLVSFTISYLVILMKSNQIECFFVPCDSHETRSGKITFQVKNKYCKSALLALLFGSFINKNQKTNPLKDTILFYFYVHFCSSNCLCYPFRNLKTLCFPKHTVPSGGGFWWGCFKLVFWKELNLTQLFLQNRNGDFAQPCGARDRQVQGMEPRLGVPGAAAVSGSQQAIITAAPLAQSNPQGTISSL